MDNILKNNSFVPIAKKTYGLLMKSKNGSVAIKYNDGNIEGFIKGDINDILLNESIITKVGSIIIVALGLTYFTTDITIVDGISMVPTYKNHEIIIKSRAARDVNKMMLDRGAIVKFKSPEGDTAIKRIIAKPGDEIEFDSIFIKVNGKIVDRGNMEKHPSYGIKKQAYSLKGTGQERKTDPYTTTITLKNNQYFLMGDNRTYSTDSRKYGPIADSSIISIINK